MTETEKITINLSTIDLGRIDLLVEEGFYSNRSDMIRTAIRNLLNTHAPHLDQTITRRSIALGVIGYDRDSLARRLEKGEILNVQVVGMLVLGKDVTPELALATLNSIKVYGSFQAPAKVKAALAEAGRILT